MCQPTYNPKRSRLRGRRHTTCALEARALATTLDATPTTSILSVGVPQPQNISAFIALGILKDNEVIEKNIAGVVFLGWRCIYAAFVTSRIEQKPFRHRKSVQTPYKYVSRYTAEAEFWKSWVQRAHFSDLVRASHDPFRLCLKHRDKT